MVNRDTGTAGWGPAGCAGGGHRTYFGDRYRGQWVQAQPRDAVRRRCLHLASSGTSHWKETQGRSEQGLGAQQGVVGTAPSPAGGGGSLAGAGCGQAAPHSPLADHSHGWLCRHPRLGSPARAGPCKQKPSVTEPSLWPQCQPQLSRALEPGSPSRLTHHCSLSPAGPPAASAPRQRGRRTVKVPARVQGSLGHTAAPPRSLEGLSAPALPRAHPCTPSHPHREPSSAHPAPLPADCRSAKCNPRPGTSCPSHSYCPGTCIFLCPCPRGAHQPP